MKILFLKPYCASKRHPIYFSIDDLAIKKLCEKFRELFFICKSKQFFYTICPAPLPNEKTIFSDIPRASA